MREIIFRGKRTDNGGWVFGNLNDFRDCKTITIVKDCSIIDSCEIIPDTVGQYTGLKDKNGVRIFEGDIIKSEQDGMIGVIRFGEYQTTNSGNGECHLGFSIEWYGKYSDLLRRDLGWWVKFGNTDINIFGNIHDNPEMVKGDRQ